VTESAEKNDGTRQDFMIGHDFSKDVNQLKKSGILNPNNI
jgi:hypothetical protein